MFSHPDFAGQWPQSVRIIVSTGLSALLFAAPRAGLADEYHYVDWQSADVALGIAQGVITLPDSSTVGVTFAAINSDGSAGNLAGAQTNGGTNYWNPSDPYISLEVENAPPDPDILQLSGGQNQVYQVTLSEPIRDPIMAIVSLGQPAVTTTYAFDAPFTIVSQGIGYWGGGSSALVALPSNVLQGNEGHGTIRFIGTFSTFSWTVPSPEYWHGFTFGIRTTERIEPTDAGFIDGGDEDGGASTDAEVSADADGEDAEVPPDAEPAADVPISNSDAQAPAPDAGAPSDAGNRPRDAGTSSDAGETTEEDGCNCETSRRSTPWNTLGWTFAILITTLWWRRRRA